MTKKTKTYTERDLFQLIQKRYEAPAWATFAQVANATGMGNTRRADAISMGLWPSRGLEIHGFEIKCRKSDWTRELKKPKKAETIAAYCDRWWIVAPSVDVVPVDQLPPNWGLYVVRGSGLYQKKEAVMLEAKPLDRQFTAAILRRAEKAQQALLAGSVPRVDLKAELNAMYEKGKEHGKLEGGSAQRRVAAFEKLIADFEKTSGVKLNRYNGPDISAAMAALKEERSAKNVVDRAKQQLVWAMDRLRRCKSELEDL